MNARNLGLLGLAAVVVILAAVWMGRPRTTDVGADRNLYPELKGKLDSIKGISIFKAGDQVAVDLVRDGDVWQVKQRDSYAADTGKVKTLLTRLEDAKLREQKTANTENYPALSVQDLTDVATTGVRVELDGTPSPVKLIVGKRETTAHATYVRRAGETQSWLISTDLDVSSDPLQWLKRDLIHLGADRIQQVETQLAGSPSYVAFKNSRADANFDVKPIPKGRELNSATAPNSVSQALVSLQMEDVRKSDAVTAAKNASHATFSAFDGLKIQCTGYVDGEHRWIVLHAEFDPELAKRFHVATAAAEKKEEGKDVPAANPATADTSLETTLKKGQDEAAALDKSVANWAYSVPTYQYDAIFKPLDDLLKKPELLKKK